MAKDIEPARSERPARRWDWFDWPDRWFEGMRPWFMGEDRLRIEQELTDDTMIVRAEMPGIDPDKDVEITVANGVLRIHAERRSEEKKEEAGRTHSEFRYGSFERTMRVPDDVKVDDIKASYRDGILEVRIPFKTATVAEAKRVPIERS
jgi:HSP20 family protein